MEGVKILSEEMIKNFGGDTMFPILIIAGLFLLIFCVCLLGKCCYGSEERFGVMAFSGAVLFIISIVGSIGNTYYEKTIKVTPIEDKYFIDATKYKVVKVEGEIIYLKDNNKYNEKGEVIE